MNVDKMYSDADLLAAIRTGDTLDEAIRYIYQHYADTISSFIMNNSGNVHDAQDIFQETVVTFIETVQKDKFRGESSIKTFLVAIARNLWLNELKRRERADYREEVYEKNRPDTEPDVSYLITEREKKQQFRELLSKLGENCRKILTLFYYENMSMKGMLAHLPYENEQVVRNKKYKCLQQLTGMLKANPAIAKMIQSKPFNK
jgi:RNA polymerase sigma factor (sigma-70 family)